MLNGFPKILRLFGQPSTNIAVTICLLIKSAFHIILMYNCENTHLNTFDSFILRLKRSMRYIQIKLFEKLDALLRYL